MNNVLNITNKFGSQAALSSALKHKHPTTVQGWVQRNCIPPKHWAAIIGAAKDRGITVTLAELAGIEAAA